MLHCKIYRSKIMNELRKRSFPGKSVICVLILINHKIKKRLITQAIYCKNIKIYLILKNENRTFSHLGF